MSDRYCRKFTDLRREVTSDKEKIAKLLQRYKGEIEIFVAIFL